MDHSAAAHNSDNFCTPGTQETSGGDDQDRDGTGPRHLPHEVAAVILDQLDAADAQRCLVEVNLFGLSDPHGEAVRQRCMRTKKRLLVRRGDTHALCYLAARGARFHMGHVRVAAAHGHEDAVRWLLANGAHDTTGCGAIESAAAGGHTGVLSRLLEAVRTRPVRAGVLRAALLAATLGGHRDAARLLSDTLAAAPEPMVLMAAALGGDLATVQDLLAAHPQWARLCAHTTYGRIVVLASDQWHQSEWTPFWRHPCARRLADAGPVPYVRGDPQGGRVPRRLDLIGAACVSGNVDAVRALWAAGAGVRDTWRDNLATWAALGSSRDVLAFVASKRAEIECAHGDTAPGPMRTDDVLRTAAISRDVDLVRLAWTLFDRPRSHVTYFAWSCGIDMARFAIDNDVVVSVAERARLMANAALNDGATAAYLIRHHADELARGLAATRNCLPRSAEAARLLFDRGLVVFTPQTVTRSISALLTDVVRYLVVERGLGMAPVVRCMQHQWFARALPPPEPDADGLCWPPSRLQYLFRYADAELAGCLLDRCVDPAERAHHTDAALCASVAFGRTDLFDALLARRTADSLARPLVFELPYHGHAWMRLDGVLLGRLVAALGAQGIDFARCNLLPWLGKRCVPVAEYLCRRGLYDPAPECARVQDASGHPWPLVRTSVADALVSSRRVVEWLAARGLWLARLCPASCSNCRNARDGRPPSGARAALSPAPREET